MQMQQQAQTAILFLLLCFQVQSVLYALDVLITAEVSEQQSDVTCAITFKDSCLLITNLSTQAVVKIETLQAIQVRIVATENRYRQPRPSLMLAGLDATVSLLTCVFATI